MTSRSSWHRSRRTPIPRDRPPPEQQEFLRETSVDHAGRGRPQLLGPRRALPAVSSAAPQARAAQAAAAPASAANPVVQWNRFLLGIQATPGAQPATVHPTYDLALMHTAIYDAVVAIHHSATPYLPFVHVDRRRLGRGRCRRGRARHARAPLPRAAALDRPAVPAALRRPADGARKTAGIRAGRLAAAQLFAHRANDGSAATPARAPARPRPGDYQPTPPAFAAPVFTHWPRVTPFVLRRANSSGRRPAAVYEPRVRRRARRRSSASVPRPARRARPTRRRSACSGTRRSGRPGTGSRRRLARPPRDDRRTRGRSPRST